MLAAETYNLGEGYTLKAVTPEEFSAVYTGLEQALFGGGVYDVSDLPSVPLARPAWTYLILHGGEVAGLHRSRQVDEHTVNMSVTALLPEHRGKGLYTRLIPLLLRVYLEVGFTFVISQHHPTNNAVIVPKLRAGFFIQGMQMTRSGMMVQLLYSFDAPYRHYLAALCGHEKSATNPATPEGENNP